MGQGAGPDLADAGDGKGHQRLSADIGAVRECPSATWSVGCEAAADALKSKVQVDTKKKLAERRKK